MVRAGDLTIIRDEADTPTFELPNDDDDDDGLTSGFTDKNRNFAAEAGVVAVDVAHNGSKQPRLET